MWGKTIQGDSTRFCDEALLGFVDEVDEACGIGTVSPEKSGHKRKYCSRKTKRKNVLRSMEMDRSATKDAIG